MDDITRLTASASVTIAASPETLYDAVSDITRMGEWSPVCRSCWWDEGAGPVAEAWFTARNVTPEREFENRSQVTVANRPNEFAWMVGGIDEGYGRWTYTFTAAEGGTRVEETWAMARMTDRIRDMTEERALAMVERARIGIGETLANLRRVVEAGTPAAVVEG